MVKIGVIGYGYWGPNLVRNFMECERAKVVAVSDGSADRLALAGRRAPGAKLIRSGFDLIHDPEIDAVVIATPVPTHFELAAEALRCGKHVFVEKPLAASAEQARRLVDLAEKHRRVLMAGHVFVYAGAVRKISELIEAGDLGKLLYYDSVRINLGLFQSGLDVMWDLAVHDLAILDHIWKSTPVAVSATGMKHFAGQPEDIAYLTVYYSDNSIAHVHVNWLAPMKIRRTLIGGSRKMVVYDDVEGAEKVKVYDKGVSIAESPEALYQMRVNYRAGDMFAPLLDNQEALRGEALEFIDSIEHGRKPLTDGESGLRVVELLEAATQSLKNRGGVIDLGVGADKFLGYIPQHIGTAV
ncbi:MAG: Gfo/Idh/MocA family oxidoreductase [Bryobacteraceae bacterium]